MRSEGIPSFAQFDAEPCISSLAFSSLPFPPAEVVSEIVISATTHFGAAGHHRADSHNVFFLSVSVRGHATLFEGACGRSVVPSFSSEEEEPICFSHMTQFLRFVEARARVAGRRSSCAELLVLAEALKQRI